MAKFEELGSLLFPAGKVAEEVQQGDSARRRFAAVNDDGTFSVIDVYVYVTNEFADEDRDDAFWDYEVQTRSVVTDSLCRHRLARQPGRRYHRHRSEFREGMAFRAWFRDSRESMGCRTELPVRA